MYFYPVIFAAALLGAAAISEAQAADARNCLIMIEGKIYLEGDCNLMHSDRRMEMSAQDPSNPYRASLERNADQSATAWWNGPEAQPNTSIEIGRLIPNGPTCWMNNRAMLCLSPVGYPSAAAYDDAVIAEIEEEIAGDQEDAGMYESSQNGPDLGSAFENMGATVSITCHFAEENILPPDRRIMARGMGGRNYTGHIPHYREFVFDGDQTVTFKGTPYTVFWKDGAKVAIRTMAEVAASSVIPGLSAEQNADLQRGLDNMRQYQGSHSGLDHRVIVLDFDARQGLVATLTGDALTERQSLNCE